MALSTLPQAENIAYFYRYTRVAPLPFPILFGDPYLVRSIQVGAHLCFASKLRRP